MYVMGIDVGTSGAKIVVFDLSGYEKASAQRTYEVVSQYKGALELNPDIVFNAIEDCLFQVKEQCDMSKVAAIAVSTQGEAVIPVDCHGVPLHNAILTFDSRNKKEYEWLINQFNKIEMMELTGLPMHPMFSATKILWLKENFRQVYEQTWKFMCFGDYVTYKLGAEPSIDYSMATRTMLFDIKNRCWSKKILEKCGIEERLLPRVVATGSIIGSVSKESSRKFGFSVDTKLVAGAHDQLCCAIGAGVFENGVIMDSLGTTESMVCINEGLILTDDMIEKNIPVYPYPINNMYAYMTFLTCCASLLSWFKTKVANSSNDNFFYDYDEYIFKHYKNPSDIYCLPYFAGAGTPSLEFKAKGLISGLTLDTDNYQLYKGIMESICFEEKINIMNMEACGISVKELRCIGGGAKSELFLQLKADILGKKITSMKIKEAGCLGAALLAALGCGAINDLIEVKSKFIIKDKEIFPRKELSEIYDESFKTYLKIYSASRAIWNEK